MDCSDSSTHVNISSENINDDLNKPSTSKQDCTNNKDLSADVIVLDDDDDDNEDDIVCILSISKSCINSTKEIDFKHDSQSSQTDIIKLQTIIKDSAEIELLFKNHLMEPLTFLLLLHDFALELKLTKVIENCGGVVYNNVNEIDDYTAVIVKDDSLHWSYLGAVFKVTYIQACIESKKILDISRFFKSSTKLKFKDTFNFMSVVYFKKYSWNDIPEKFISPKKTYCSLNKSEGNQVRVSQNWSKVVPASKSTDVSTLSDEEEFGAMDKKLPPKTSPHKKLKISQKHTKMLYSRKEDEDIIKYIVRHEGYDNLKGVMFWKKMEGRDICPTRTWQSVKEHFLKKLVYNLTSFKFLTEKQINLLQVSALRKQ